ncbi:MAG TPA: PorP/SprF family type IX secretion system membrane protein [Puia sp.]|nr:PorP/SprF family type IX secretion system membrane protein [Puia sp.]
MRKHRLYIVLLLLLGTTARAQDIHFSQFFETPLLRNPSLAGIFTGDFRLQTVLRDQWNSFADAYRTGSLNAEFKWSVGHQNDYITTAFEALYDKAGTAALTTTELLPALNYHKSLSNDRPMFLSLGFMGGLVEKTLDLSKVTTNSQYNGTAYDPALPNGETILSPNVHYLDGSLGLSFNTAFGHENQNSMYAGFAYHHLNRPKNSFYKNPAIELDPKIVFSAGVKSVVNDYSYFTLYGDYSRQGPATETIMGVLYSYKLGPDPDNYPYTFTLGSLLRWNDALIPVVKLEMTSFTVGLSYDVNVSRLNTVSNSRGGFELSLSYTGLLDRDRDRTFSGKYHDPRF